MTKQTCEVVFAKGTIENMLEEPAGPHSSISTPSSESGRVLLMSSPDSAQFSILILIQIQQNQTFKNWFYITYILLRPEIPGNRGLSVWT